MKKILFAAVAVMAMAACSNEDVISRPALPVIGFDNAFVENSTRAATDITGANLYNFGVYGSVTNGQGQKGVIFSNQEVRKNGDLFTYSPVQYWIPGSNYKFLAIAPFDAAKWGYTLPENANAVEKGTITFDNAAALASQDLLFAAAAKTTPATLTADPGKVAFTFGHVLSRVVFTFTNSFAENSNITLKVHNVAINNTAATGTLPVVDSATGVWTGAGNYKINFGPTTLGEAPELAENNGMNTTEHFYLIPVKRTYNITFQVTMFQAGVQGQTFTHTIDKEIDFAKGGNYSLNIVLNQENVNPSAQLYPIEFTVESVTGWTEPATGNDLKEPTTGNN